MVSFSKFQGSKISFTSRKNCLISQLTVWLFGFIKKELDTGLDNLLSKKFISANVILMCGHQV